MNTQKNQKDPNLTTTIEFCAKKNIPFSVEEANLYRLKQNQQNYKSFATSLNHCYETARPDEFKTGFGFWTDADGAPKQNQITKDF